MGNFPEPRAGMVIRYVYLWSDEAERQVIEGAKGRPCAIVVAVESGRDGGAVQVAVVPVTHARPHDPEVAIELPARVKAALGLDAEPSWIMLDEMNVFDWPGYDLRPIGRGSDRVDYGFLPPRYFARLMEQLTGIAREIGVTQVLRD